MNISLSSWEYQAAVEPYLRGPEPWAYHKLASTLLAIILAGSLIGLGGNDWGRTMQEADDIPKIEANYWGI